MLFIDWFFFSDKYFFVKLYFLNGIFNWELGMYMLDIMGDIVDIFGVVFY